MPSKLPYLFVTMLVLLLSPLITTAADKNPPVPSWTSLTKDETYDIEIVFLPDSKIGGKVAKQITLTDKDCERNGNKSLEKEDANSFITAECNPAGNIIIRRTTLQPLGKLKQDLNLTSVGTSRLEILQGSDYYPDLLIKVNRVKTEKPKASPAPKVAPASKETPASSAKR